MRAPSFWSEKNSALSGLLVPLGGLWRLGGWIRGRMIRPYRSRLPVLCVGNLVVGGAGKTPTALSLAPYLQRQGHRPVFLTRGYGGRLTGPLQVDLMRHSAAEVGDEPMLLAAVAPTVVARDRAAGARFIESPPAGDGALGTVILMDDGFQNPRLAKDRSLLVMDGSFGIGNGRLMPAGPLREPLANGLARAEGVLVIGDDAHEVGSLLPARLPLFHGHIRIRHPERVVGRRLVAFAGIGRPDKLFDSLRACGAELAATRAFPDHHAYTETDLAALSSLAETHRAELVTTTKDAVRLMPDWRSRVHALQVELVWSRPDALEAWLQELGTGA